jgi:TM2 domain-containing membrane protein YozV
MTVDTEPPTGDIPLMDSTTAIYSDRPSDKSRGVALALAAVLGLFGGHRFYVGKTRSGVLMAVTIGGLGLWYLYDLILIASGSFRDAEGYLVRRWDPQEATPGSALPSEILDELEQLRLQVAELAERVDFAERLLASPRPEHDTARPTVPS